LHECLYNWSSIFFRGDERQFNVWIQIANELGNTMRCLERFRDDPSGQGRKEHTIAGWKIGFVTKLLKKNPAWKILVFFHSSG
jgi:hypothetical protein